MKTSLVCIGQRRLKKNVIGYGYHFIEKDGSLGETIFFAGRLTQIDHVGRQISVHYDKKKGQVKHPYKQEGYFDASEELLAEWRGKELAYRKERDLESKENKDKKFKNDAFKRQLEPLKDTYDSLSSHRSRQAFLLLIFSELDK